MITANGAKELTQQANFFKELEKIKRMEAITKAKQNILNSTAEYCEKILSDLITTAAKNGQTEIQLEFSATYNPVTYEQLTVRYVLKDEGPTYADGRHSYEPKFNAGVIDTQVLIDILKKLKYNVTTQTFSYWEYYLGKKTGYKIIISWAN